MKQFVDNPRPFLAAFWSLVSALLLFYIVSRWGQKVEILTLIIGLIGGTIVGGIFGYYYSATHTKPGLPSGTITDLTATKTEETVTTTSTKA